MREISYSLLREQLAAGGEIKTRPEAHENDMALVSFRRA